MTATANESAKRSGPHRARALDGSELPVATLGQALGELRRPFTAAAVRYKLQTKTYAICYIDARLVAERLNLVCGHLWSDAYEQLPYAGHLLCRLTVDGVTRENVGGQSATDPTKGMFSDALKRAAVRFGVGVSLSVAPGGVLPAGQVRTNSQGKQVGITREGEQALRKRYSTWLAGPGTRAFGAPLDHGDILSEPGAREDDPEETAGQSPAPAAGLDARGLDARGLDLIHKCVVEYQQSNAHDAQRLRSKLLELSSHSSEDQARHVLTRGRESAIVATALSREPARDLYRWLQAEQVAALEPGAHEAEGAGTDAPSPPTPTSAQPPPASALDDRARNLIFTRARRYQAVSEGHARRLVDKVASLAPSANMAADALADPAQVACSLDVESARVLYRWMNEQPDPQTGELLAPEQSAASESTRYKDVDEDER